jgi:steroid delta-isomerase-like uncharacterized protein
MDIKSLARTTIEELFDKGRTGYLNEVSELSFIGHDPVSLKSVSLDEEKRIAETFREGFPDLRCSVDDTITEGDRCVCRWRMTGTHSGTFVGIPPTGRKVVVDGISEMRFHQGRLAEQWTLYDFLGLLSQLGAVPSLEAMVEARRVAEAPENRRLTM